jgi:putative ABC transport system permease protein
VAERTVPGATVTELRGPEVASASWVDVSLTVPGSHDSLLDSYGSALGSDVLVSSGSLPPGLVGLAADARDRAEEALASGRSVVLTNMGEEPDRVVARVQAYDDSGDRVGRRLKSTLPVVPVPVEFAQAGPQAVLTDEAARRLGVPVTTVGLAVTGADISERQEQDLDETVAGLAQGASFTVERGYQTDQESLIIQLILFGLGAVLMLGGTLTATFLALSDARPDLATLAAVGAAPRTRRGVAAAYALVVGVVGATLGAVIGFIPGIAITYPLTRGDWMPSDAGATHFLEVPWLLVGGLVVALPLVTALVMAASARSRLPLVARLD